MRTVLQSHKELEDNSLPWWQSLDDDGRNLRIMFEYFVIVLKMNPRDCNKWIGKVSEEDFVKMGLDAEDWWNKLSQEKKTESIIKSYCSEPHLGMAVGWNGR